ncbi:putative Cryptochrome DASH [Candidatus Competibacter denitrificans Run_A_D11]|uniref:Cryptochrome DASH n=1 Tax=Candidatus Competibacter denitrificans Run_A_D11 TaxID=1400863 RepID=W6M3R1_9GAMM|nr:FAD-binding domain-containing protein [Candidatus Competibacter denitrificans]CDI02292.1 putative Cryptochrome DASH [Candidatus Competibacter denitrificans Run_A_D11]HRC69562.1 FAD-binding domain-containing protein [Candidatus Competibacter denitrificans]
MNDRRAMLWFRNDLRLHDHDVLTWLANTMDVLVPVYCLDPRLFTLQPLGFPRMGPLRARFLIECLEDLRTGLEARGSGLHVVVGEPETEIPRLAKMLGVGVVFAERGVLSEAVGLERRLLAALERIGVMLRGYSVATLIHPDDLPFPLANLPEPFNRFREAALAASEPRAPLPPLRKLPTFPAEFKTETLATLVQAAGLLLEHEPSQQPGFKGGATVALARLQDFVQGRRASLDTLRGGAGELTAAQADRFAPWLARGAISPRSIYQYVKYSGLAAWAGELAKGTIDELLRRDYCRFLAIARGGKTKRSDPVSGLHDGQARERFESWCRGETGQPFVDAHLRELAQTGYLTAFGRRLVASYLCHQLRVDWRWGAAWFASQLLDDDAAVNLAGWMEVIGRWRLAEPVADADPAEEAARHDPDGVYTRRWLMPGEGATRRVG